MVTRRNNRDPKQGQGGLTLVEMLVALAVSAFLLLGLATIFQENQRTQRFQTALSRVQENARFVVSDMKRTLRQVGYRGCGGGSGDKTVENKLTGPDASLYDLGTASELQGHRHDGSAWQPSDPQIDSSVDTATVRANDVLRMRTLAPVDARVDGIHDTTNSTIELAGADGDKFRQCDVLTVSTCSAVVQVINTNNSASSTKVTHSNGNNCNGSGDDPDIQNSSNKINNQMDNGEVLKTEAYTYYIDRPTGSSVPALMREDAGGATVELARGVQRMRLTYGEDTDNDGQVDTYRSGPGAVSDWTAVLGVRLELLFVSPTKNVVADAQTYEFAGTTATAGDKRLYQVVTTTVALRNRM